MPMPNCSWVNLLFFAGVPIISPSFASALLAAGAPVDAEVVELSVFGADWHPHSRQTAPTAVTRSGSLKLIMNSPLFVLTWVKDARRWLRRISGRVGAL